MSSTHCFLCTENRRICHGAVSSAFLISHTCIAHTGNFIMYVLGPFSQKQSHICNQIYNKNEQTINLK